VIKTGRAQAQKIDLRYIPDGDEFNLEEGWVVERHLQDGDVVLFNRQPSLHKMSIMAHKVKVLLYSTFRLNLSVTTPYNADFDGDEMNLHVPQNLTARAEAEELMMVQHNIVTPQSNRNVMGIVQDALLAVQRFTKRGTFLTRGELFDCIGCFQDDWDGTIPSPAILLPEPLWTGKQVFSLFCPEINYKGTSHSHNDSKDNSLNLQDTKVLIKKGELFTGMVDKRIVGTSGGSLIHIMWLKLGWFQTMKFMNVLQRVVNHWFAGKSYSIGISDCVCDPNTAEVIQNRLQKTNDTIKELLGKAMDGTLDRQPGFNILESLEALVNDAYNNERNDMGVAVQKSLTRHNRINNMIKAGSKGSLNNLSQIIANVGQQNVDGKRIAYGFKQRTLPCFQKDDLYARTRGFVKNSYLRGLAPSEFWFHGMAGREGIIDTAVKTSLTGYIQRRLVKTMETNMVHHDGTVRDSKGNVVQFLYGDDGMDGMRIEKQRFDHLLLNDQQMHDQYFLEIESDDFGYMPGQFDSLGRGINYLFPEVLYACQDDTSLSTDLQDEFDQLEKDRRELREILGCRGHNESSNPNVYLPVNVDRLIWDAQIEFRVNILRPSDLHPKDILKATKEIEQACKVVRIKGKVGEDAQSNSTELFNMFIRSKLACKPILMRHRLSSEALHWLKGQIILEFQKALAHAGEMCGVLAAQSIGEPATQMTLNTFHSTGISAKNVTLGVPRLNELLNVTQNLKTPSLIIHMKDDKGLDMVNAQTLQAELEYLVMGDLVNICEIIYDPDLDDTVVDEDQILFADFLGVQDEDLSAYSPWLLRITLDTTRFYQCHLTMAQIANAITDNFDDLISVWYSDDNATKHVLRIRITIMETDVQVEPQQISLGVSDDQFLARLQHDICQKLRLTGTEGIKKVYMHKSGTKLWDDEFGGFRDGEEHSEWVLETDGTNLKTVLNHPRVDATKIISNDVLEVLSVFGIEASRSSLFNELRNVLSFDGSYVNYRHIAVLVDTMCFSGGILPVSRHGVSKSGAGPLLKASFERTVDVLMESATFAEKDVLNGVTENILCGQLAHAGTGIVEMMMDPTAMLQIEDLKTGLIGKESQLFDEQGERQITPYSENQRSVSKGGDMTSLEDGFEWSPMPTPGTGGSSPSYNFASSSSPQYYTSSPMYDFSSPQNDGGGTTSPQFRIGTSNYMDSSPNYMSSTSPNYMDTSPNYSPTSPNYSPTSPNYSPTSPNYSPTSPNYSPTSPNYSPTSPNYSPTSPNYSPTSPNYSPTSPNYSPTSPNYSPTSPNYSPTSPNYSPTSPNYSPMMEDEEDFDDEDTVSKYLREVEVSTTTPDTVQPFNPDSDQPDQSDQPEEQSDDDDLF